MRTDFVSKLDELVRQGEFDKVRVALRALELKHVPRTLAPDLASIARRVQLYKAALRLLHPIVRPDIPRRKEPTPREWLEYGLALLRAGAPELARSILQKVDGHEHPQQLLYLAMCATTEWNYVEAKALLLDYLGSPGISDYQRLIAKTNLAAAYVFLSEIEAASDCLSDLRAQTKKENHLLLLGNALELSAQLAIQTNQYKAARSFLSESQNLIGGSRSATSLYVQKWMAVVDSIESGKVTARLRGLPQLARDAGDWETARDSDYHIASLTGDTQLLAHLRFGSPFQGFRDKIEKRFPEISSIGTYFWSAQGKEIVLDLASGSSDRQTEPMQAGSLLHRLLVLLTQDFYRPLNKVTAFSKLYPGEYFDPFHSANRIHQVVSRLREWLSSNEYPLEILEARGAYRLEFRGPIAVRIDRTEKPATVWEARLHRLREQFGDTPFSSTQVRESLELSFGSANELIKRAIDDDRLVKFGRGPQTRYRFKSD